MKISGVNISGGIRLDPPVAPTPAGLSKIMVGASNVKGQLPNNWSTAGAVYVYNPDGTGELKILAPNVTASNNQFGYRVAMSDTKIAATARGWKNPAGNKVNQGAAFIFNPDGTGEVMITASDGAANDNFGDSLAMSDTKIVMGAPKKTISGSDFMGALYIYNLDGTGEVKITASDRSAFSQFGRSVAISNTKIAVGSGSRPDGDKGAVYVYNTDGTGEQKIQASDGAANDTFGWSVAISDTKVVAGSIHDDDAGGSSGSVYVYNLDGTGEVKLTASDGAADDQFGWSVAVSDTKVVVGSPWGASGSAYIYNLDGTGEVKITASDGAADDYFGRSVAIQGDKIIVGAYGDDDNGSTSGSVYVYNLDGTGELKITASDGAGNDRFGWSVAAN